MHLLKNVHMRSSVRTNRKEEPQIMSEESRFEIAYLCRPFSSGRDPSVAKNSFVSQNRF